MTDGWVSPAIYFELLQALLVSHDHLHDHLAADGAGFTGGQVTVVTVGQVDADLGSGLHLELVHCLTGLGDVDLVVALHIHSLLLSFSRKARRLSGENAFFLSATIALPNQRKI